MAKGDKERQQNVADTMYQHSTNFTNTPYTNQQSFLGPAYQNYMTQTPKQLQTADDIYKNLNQFYNPSAGMNMSRGDTSSFGNLTDPNAWMSLVGNTPQLQQWIRASYPGLSDEGVNYYTQHIQEKPGANPTEQAGSAAYWQGRMPEWLQQHGGGVTNDPFYNAVTNALGGYGNFAQTGGFSPQDIQNIRARMVAPIRSIYSSANRDVDRQRRLQHGYSPNYTAAKAKMAREQAYATSDATTNAEAAIAGLLQSGKLAGLGGLGQTGAAARGQNLSALNAMTNLYGTTPAQAQLFGNQVLGSTGQGIDIAKLQAAIDQNKVQNQLGIAQVPSDFQQFLGYTGEIADLIGRGATAASGWQNLLKPKTTLGQVGKVVSPTG